MIQRNGRGPDADRAIGFKEMDAADRTRTGRVQRRYSQQDCPLFVLLCLPCSALFGSDAVATSRTARRVRARLRPLRHAAAVAVQYHTQRFQFRFRPAR
eukprot:gene13584-biopygen15597